MRLRTRALAPTVLLTTLLLAGCGQNGGSSGTPGMNHGSTPKPSSTSSATTKSNPADEMFVTMMIPHHEQAIEMADMILGKDDIDQRVVTLAQQIKDAQGPEITTMKGWLSDWGIPAGPTSSGGMEGMEGMDDGMMSEQDMAALTSATGTDATRLFLEGMITHHQGAIAMARSELDGGQNPAALKLAQQVIDGQSAEVRTMQNILDSL